MRCQTYAAGRASNTELLMLVLDLKVDYRLKKYFKVFLWNVWNVLMRMCRQKKNMTQVGLSNC